MKTYVIVGAGVAGASAAGALRGQGFDGRVVLLGEERDHPYQRPPLSKELLRGEVAADFPLLRTDAFYQDNAIELYLGQRVTHIDPSDRRMVGEGGFVCNYDKLLIATGGSPRRLTVRGGDLSGVHYLRTLSQALELRKELERRPNVLIVGGGFIGCEVAASARQIGCDVTIASTALPLARALGPQVGAIYAGYHGGHGVQVRTGVTVTEFRGGGKLEEATLSDGSVIPCALAVVGIGIKLSLGMLTDIDTRDGLAGDEFCRTDIEDVFVAGDIARSWRPRLDRHVRLEHFENAALQGAAAARSMCGKLEAYDSIPFFWSDQYEYGLQYYGNSLAWDQVVLRGQPEQGSFTAFYLKRGRIEAGCLVNRSRDASVVKRLLGQTDLPISDLQNDAITLKTFLPKATGTTSEASK